MSSDNDFFKWQEDNKGKSSKPGLTERADGRIKTQKVDTKRKKRKLSRRTERQKKKVYVYSKYREFDFMKYSILVEHWAMLQYDWTREEMGLIFYLYSEDYFTKDGFLEHSRIITGKTRRCFDDFIKNKILEEIPREDVDGKGHVKLPRIYRLSHQTKNRVKAIYNRLLLETKIDESNKKSKVFRTQKATIRDKQIAKGIRKMNEDIDRIKNGSDSHINDDFVEFEN